MTSKSFRTWCDRLDFGRFTKGQVQQFYNAVYPLAHFGQRGGKATSLTHDEASELVERLELSGGVLISPEHFAQGEAWLDRYGAKFGLPVGTVLRFRFVGAHLEEDTTWRVRYAPIYRTWLTDGRVFDYAPTAWQACSNVGLWWEYVAA